MSNVFPITADEKIMELEQVDNPAVTKIYKDLADVKTDPHKVEKALIYAACEMARLGISKRATNLKLIDECSRHPLLKKERAPYISDKIDIGWAEGEKQALRGTLETQRASDISMRAIRWLWPDRFALGKLGLIGGLPDKGKGLLTCDFMACVTNNHPLPCNEGTTSQGSVILLTAEDDYADTVIPRLKAARADLKKIHIVKMYNEGADKQRVFSLLTDLGALRSKIEEIPDTLCVIIDPMSAYLGVGKVNNNSTTDVRGFLKPLTDLAAEKMILVLGIMHFNKKVDVTNAMLRIADSASLTRPPPVTSMPWLMTPTWKTAACSSKPKITAQGPRKKRSAT